jgi:stringent starvation protein B
MMAASMDVRDTESKKTVLTDLLEQGMVLVTLDARCAGVDVPKHLGGDAQLRLNLSYRFGLPMQLDDEAVTATLTFAGTPYACRLPWNAIYLFVSHVTGRPILFPADVPSEFATGMFANRNSALPSRRPAGRPRLRVVSRAAETASAGAMSELATDASDPSEPADPAEPRTPPRRGHLRVIK